MILQRTLVLKTTKPDAPWAVTTVKRTRCGATVVATMKGWWRRGVGFDEEMEGDELVKMVVVVSRGVGMGGGAAVGGGYEGEARGGVWSGRSDRSGGGESFGTQPEKVASPEYSPECGDSWVVAEKVGRRR
ncbi:hypothetical protein Tco_0419097 [Tanacetum coccineum]